MELVGIREDVLDELGHSDYVIRELFSGRRRQLVAEFIENTVKQGSTICVDQTDSVLLGKHSLSKIHAATGKLGSSTTFASTIRD
jgi:hypothetical protein